MQKAYKMLLALVAIVLGSASASAVKADLDPAMFKAWDGYGANANVVAEPENCPNSDGTTSPFGCDFKLYETVGAGACVYGNTNVYYLWYADITGTNTITFEGTPGLQLRILLNRPEPTEGGDPHGGQSDERNVTLDADGVATLDVSSLEYVHINTIKLGWGSPEGIIRKIELEGSVKPVTGWVDILSNGDFEGTDVHNFVVALDAVKDQGVHEPTIVDGAGVDGSRAIVVESMDDPTETWQTQFFIKFDEFLPEGTQWRLTMDIKADQDAECGSGCHAAPRSWLDGSLFDPNPYFTTEWQSFEASGTLKKYGDDGLGSIAFDLNVLGAANKYYFDNIHFEVFNETTPVSLISAQYEADVVRVNFGKDTNLRQLIKDSGLERIVYDIESASVVVNGQPTTLLSVEGRNDGYLWIFIDENYPENEDDIVSVNFANPSDPAKQIVFTAGKYEGEAVPAFTNILATYNGEEGIGNNYSYILGTPAIETADPENGSFNLPEDLKEFKITFDTPVEISALSATLDKEKLTISPADGRSKQVTLTRTGSNPLTGVHTLILSNVLSREDQFDDPGYYELNYSFGPVVIDPNDQPKDLIDAALFNDCADNSIPMGFIVDFNGEIREGGSSQGSGPRIFSFQGDFTKGLYFREGNVTYGAVEGYELDLQAGKKYNIHFNSAQWKSNGTQMTFEILDENDEAVVTETVAPAPNVNGATGSTVNGSTSTDMAFIPDADGKYRLRWTSNGFVEVLLANPQMKYVPNVLGVEELTMVATALENAKSVREANSDSRYDGAAFDALTASINKYDGATFTAPSACRAAVAELDAAAQAMNDHRKMCDTYDPLPEQAQEVIANNAEKKFNRTEIYANLVRAFNKYATVKSVTMTDPETGEEFEQVQVEAKVLKDDAELQTAIDELQGNIDLANQMFTEGPSKVGDWSSTRTGYATLVDRIRQGAEALTQLGVPDTDELIVAANDALADDDNLANAINLRIKAILFEQLKNANNTVFEPTGEFDDDLNPITPTYNMTSFVKNPNIYKLSDGNGYKAGAVPGWEVIDGRGFSTGWNEYGSATVPVDAMFSNWGGSFTVYQTVADLPAGVYTLNAGYGERDTQNEGDVSYFYAKTSEMVEDSLICEAPSIGQAFPEITTTEITDVVVADGILTLGVQASASSHVFFDAVKVTLTAAANGVDYGKLYEEVLAGVDVTTVKPEHIRAIEMFDLNGRRVSVAQKGVTILRKVMSDGTVRTEKVVIR